MAQKVVKSSLILMLLAVFPAAWSLSRWEVHEDELRPFEITTSKPVAIDAHALWVDARSEAHYRQGHVTGALRLNGEEWDTLLGGVFEHWQPDQPIIVYCDAGCQSSEKIAARLRDMGLEPVYFLRGGYEAWKKTQGANP